MDVDALADAVSQKLAERRQSQPAMRFLGIWQQALRYRPGAVVTYCERGAFVAVRDIAAGGQPPAREGSGWIRLS